MAAALDVHFTLHCQYSWGFAQVIIHFILIFHMSLLHFYLNSQHHLPRGWDLGSQVSGWFCRVWISWYEQKVEGNFWCFEAMGQEKKKEALRFGGFLSTRRLASIDIGMLLLVLCIFYLSSWLCLSVFSCFLSFVFIILEYLALLLGKFFG